MSGEIIEGISRIQVVRDLYLDLLIKSVTNLIYGPLPSDLWNDGLFRADAKAGRNKDSPAHSMVGLLRLENVRELVQRAIDQGTHGDFIETGVWRGGCCILMRGVLAANSITDRKVYIADSFQGLPPSNPTIFPQDAGSNWHTLPGLAVSLEDVRSNFARYGLLDDQVVFVKGFFSETLPRLNAGPFALIRLDGDMYESTYVALKCLYPKVSIGGFVIIDDYGAVAQCRQAVEDYRSRTNISDAMHQIDFTGVWWQKTN
jgi:O-methyltransferase